MLLQPMQHRHEIPTPALLLDLDAFERNLQAMAQLVAARGLFLRPHGKTHKCPEIARRQIAAGAVGVCAAKLGEAEVFADAALRGLLVTTPVVGASKISRAAALASRAPDTIFSVDDEQNVRDLDAEADRAGVIMNLAVDLDFGRTGIAPGEPARALAERIDRLPHVRFAGLQAYDAAASHVPRFEDRRVRSRESMARALETRDLIERSGIPCPLVSGGSTGTCLIDRDIDGITELQPGSYVFMDADYLRLEGPGGEAYRTFARALTVITTVVSRGPARAIVDGGFKAFATDRSFAPEPVDLPGVTYAWAGDEHGRLDTARAARDLRVGDRVEFVPPHCDPTINLYDRLYITRGDRLEDIWPVAARGRSD